VPKVGKEFELTMGGMATAGQRMQLSLDQSLTRLTQNNANAATETASTWERVKAALGTTWDNIVSELQTAGIDMQSITEKTGTSISAETEKTLTSLLTSVGLTAEQAKLVWQQFGVDMTGETKRTFKTMEQTAQEHMERIKAAVSSSIGEIIAVWISGEGDISAVVLRLFDRLLQIVIDWAVNAILATEAVAAMMETVMTFIVANPWLALGAAAAAMIAVTALRNALKPRGGPTDATPLAEGGIVTKPTLALIGEAGPEAVIPLSRGRRGPGAGGVTVNVTVTGNNISGDREADALARKVAQSITDQLRRQGIKPAYSY
jgi:hypothetical protein